MVKPRRRFNVPMSVLLATCTLLGLGLLELVTDDLDEEEFAQNVVEQSVGHCDVIPLPRGRMVVVPHVNARSQAAVVLPGGATARRSGHVPVSRMDLRQTGCL